MSTIVVSNITIPAGGLSDGSVTSSDIADGAVTGAKISDSAVTASKLSGAQTGTAPVYGARAWVNFNGTGTVTIRASGNVSSITDGGTGVFTVNLTTALPDANYAAVVTCGDTDGTTGFFRATSSSLTSSTFRFTVSNSATTSADPSYVGVVFFR